VLLPPFAFNKNIINTIAYLGLLRVEQELLNTRLNQRSKRAIVMTKLKTWAAAAAMLPCRAQHNPR
jgi:predicted transcriptional regulator